MDSGIFNAISSIRQQSIIPIATVYMTSYPKGKKIGCFWRTFFASENKNSTSKKISPHRIGAVAFSTPSVQFANNLSQLSNPFCWYQLGLSFQKSSTELRRKEKSFYFLTELDWLQGNAVPKLGCGIFVTIYWPNFSGSQFFNISLFWLKVTLPHGKGRILEILSYQKNPKAYSCCF